MPIEAPVNYIEDLNETWPAGPEDSGDGDNHLVNIKVAVKGSFPNLGQAPVTKTAAELNTGFVDGGTINNATFSGTQLGFAGDVAGNADTATNFNSSRTVQLTGDVTGTNSSDSGNHAITTTIANGAVGTNNIENNAVTFSAKINRTVTDGTITGITSSAPKFVPSGVVNIGNVTASAGVSCKLQIFDGVLWCDVTGFIPFGSNIGRQVVSDGANVRLLGETATPATVRYRRIFA